MSDAGYACMNSEYISECTVGRRLARDCLRTWLDANWHNRSRHLVPGARKVRHLLLTPQRQHASALQAARIEDGCPVRQGSLAGDEAA